MYLCVSVCRCLCMCLPHFHTSGCLTVPGAHWLASRMSRKPSGSYSLTLGLQVGTLAHSVLYTGAEDLNSDPYVCTASHLPSTKVQNSNCIKQKDKLCYTVSKDLQFGNREHKSFLSHSVSNRLLEMLRKLFWEVLRVHCRNKNETQGKQEQQ